MQEGWQLKSIQVPAAQEVHAVAPALLYEPAKQQTHVVPEEAPRAMLYLPAAQKRHAALELPPGVGLNLPAAQARHAALELPFGAGLKVPVAQLVHDDAPPVLYVPAKQG